MIDNNILPAAGWFGNCPIEIVDVIRVVTLVNAELARIHRPGDDYLRYAFRGDDNILVEVYADYHTGEETTHEYSDSIETTYSHMCLYLDKHGVPY